MEKRKKSKEKTKKPVAVKKIKVTYNARLQQATATGTADKKIKPKLNSIGYPVDDPYGLAAAFVKTFG